MRQSPTTSPTIASILTPLILVLLPVATGVGLFATGLYRDTAWMIPQARGQDLVSLIVAETLLLVAFIWATLWSRQRGVTARLLWMGALAYVLYTYAMYSYTTYFNALFLVYVALFSASLFALIDLLAHLDVAQAQAAARPGMPRRVIAGYLALVGLFFLVAWLGQIVPALLRGAVPAVVLQAKTPTSSVHVQDLAVVIPLLFVAAVWLWRGRPWGFTLAAILLVLSDIMLVAIVSMSLFSAQAGIAGALDLIWVFVALTVVSLVITGLFFGRLGRPSALTTSKLLAPFDTVAPSASPLLSPEVERPAADLHPVAGR